MSDYMFMLENHLHGEQSRFLARLQAACDAASVNVFLVGGAMRDMLGGFAIRDLDFAVEGNAVTIAKALAASTGAKIVSLDEARKHVELTLPGGSTASIAMTLQEHYPKPGARPRIAPASIHEDLRCRDFTVNSIALSLGKASKGLLLDPTNGLADLERRELRAVSNYGFYNDPVRMWRFIRLRVRLGFTAEERTLAQYHNARQAGVEKSIRPRALLIQLQQIAKEPNPADVVQALAEEGLLELVSPALRAAKLNLQGFAKLTKARQLVPFGLTFPVNDFALFLHLITEKLTPKERAAMMKAVGADRSVSGLVRTLETRAKKLEAALKSAKLHKASQIYQVLAEEPGETVLFLYLNTKIRLVQDRIRNYLQKYLPAAAEVSDREIEAEGLTPGMPKFAKRKAEKIAAKLDARVRRAPLPPPFEMAPTENQRRAV